MSDSHYQTAHHVQTHSPNFNHSQLQNTNNIKDNSISNHHHQQPEENISYSPKIRDVANLNNNTITFLAKPNSNASDSSNLIKIGKCFVTDAGARKVLTKSIDSDVEKLARSNVQTLQTLPTPFLFLFLLFSTYGSPTPMQDFRSNKIYHSLFCYWFHRILIGDNLFPLKMGFGLGHWYIVFIRPFCYYWESFPVV